jgi:hypothetical protein
VDNPARYGFRPVKGIQSADFVPVWRDVASAYQAAPGGTNVDLNLGDPVIRVNDGTVAIAGVTGVIYGVIVGFGFYWNAALGRMEPGNKLPGGTTYASFDRRSRVLVLPVFGNLFEVDVDDAVTATTEAAYRACIGENVNTIYSASATTGLASPRVDISLKATTNTFQWQIQEVGSKNNLDYAGANVKLIVSCNLPDISPFVATGV